MHNSIDLTLEELIKKAIDGDIEARTRLIEHPVTVQLVNKVSTWASRKYKLDREEIREVVLVKIFNRIETLKDPSQLNKWCYGVAEKYCLNQLRHLRVEKEYQELELADQLSRHGKRHGRPLELPYLVPSPEEELLIKELKQLSSSVLKRAARPFPDSLVKAWMEGKTHRQISEETGMSIATVSRRLKEMQKAFVKEFLSEIEIVTGQTHSLQSKIENEKILTRYILEGLRSE